MMKKLLVGLAFATPACANAATSVTLYGLLDGAMQYQTVKIDGYGKTSKYGMTSDVRAGSRWGLRGSEDLGNGVRALFVLENGFNLRNGTAGDATRTAFNRQAYMGISSESLGTLTLGRQYSAFSYFGSFGSFATGFGLAGSSRAFSSAFVRYDNLIKYETPKIYGLKAQIGYSDHAGLGTGAQNPGPGENNDKAINAFMAGLLYENGPFRFTANFDRIGKVPNKLKTETGSIKAWNTAASYDFKVVKVTAAFGQDINGRIGVLPLANLNTLTGGTPVPNVVYMKSFKANNYNVGLNIPTGDNSQILLNFMVSDSNLKDIKTVGNNGVGTQQSVSLGYTHDLSKRTSAYIVGTYMKNPAFIADASAQEYTIGLMHRF